MYTPIFYIRELSIIINKFLYLVISVLLDFFNRINTIWNKPIYPKILKIKFTKKEKLIFNKKTGNIQIKKINKLIYLFILILFINPNPDDMQDVNIAIAITTL